MTTEDLRLRDPQDMLGLVRRFPQMCAEAWRLAPTAPLPALRPQVVVALGMGGSGIGGDLLRAVLFDEPAPPVVSVKEYRAPGFAGARSVVFVCSYSGDTEETLAAYDAAAAQEAVCVAITSGGTLLRRARERGHPAVIVPPGLPPRAALPYLFLPMLRALQQMGAVRTFDAECREGVEVLQQIADAEDPGRPEASTRRLAQRLPGRIPVVYSATPFLEPAAERWKDQFNENAKTFAVWNTFPELNHNETVGWGLDEALARVLHVIVLRDVAEAERLTRRVSVTQEIALHRAAGFDEVRAAGRGKLARLLSVILMGDLVSWHLAVLRGVDPTPVAVIDELKHRLAT